MPASRAASYSMGWSGRCQSASQVTVSSLPLRAKVLHTTPPTITGLALLPAPDRTRERPVALRRRCPDLELDGVEFCLLVSGRGRGDGLLAVRVPFGDGMGTPGRAQSCR